MIDLETTQNILALSQLTASDEEKAMLTAQVGKIIAYFEVLKKHSTEYFLNEQNSTILPETLRQDEVQPSLETKVVKSFAVSFLDQYFVVPSILDKNEESS